MRVVTNQAIIDRNKRIAQTLFFVSIAGMIGSIFLVNSIAAENPDLASSFQCVSLTVLMILVIMSVRMTNLWVRQPYPWKALEEGLKATDKNAVLYHYLMPAPHVLITQNGVFAMVTRFQERPQTVVDGKWRTGFNILTFMRQEQIGNPTDEARYRAKQTEVFLQELLEDPSVEVNPLIVFVHPRAEVEIEGDPIVPILYASAAKKKESLKSFMQKHKKEGAGTGLTEEQIAELDDVLLFLDE